MIKVFTLNENNKIELTQKELKKLLDDVYWEGYRDNNHTYIYTSPISYPYFYPNTPISNTATTTSFLIGKED